MSYISFLDPFFDFETIEQLLSEIETLIVVKNKQLEENWEAWLKNNKQQKTENTDYYDHIETTFQNENFLIAEFERNLLNGVTLTLGTVFERHVGFMAREIGRNYPEVYNPKKRLIMRNFSVWLPKFLKDSNHPNALHVESELLERLQTYVNIRNILVHHDGFVDDEDKDVRKFVKANPDLISINNEQLWKITVKYEYIRNMIKDQKNFFKVIFYTDSGGVIYY